MEDIKNYAGKEIIIALVGNKVDLEKERVVKKEEGEAFAKRIGALFFETSAKDNINIE